MGVWIETSVSGSEFAQLDESHPSWVCGLKQNEFTDRTMEDNVTPLVGVWIETPWVAKNLLATYSHTPRGCVD